MTKETFQLASDSNSIATSFKMLTRWTKTVELNAGAVSQGQMYQQKSMKHCLLR